MPAGASRSTSAYSVVASGAKANPVSSSSTPITPIDGANGSGAEPRASRTMRIRKRFSTELVQDRAPYQSPPITEPSAQTVISGPTAPREPSASANAGSATSSAPKETAVTAPANTSVRMPAERSAPARVRSASASCASLRAAGAVANPIEAMR